MLTNWVKYRAFYTDTSFSLFLLTSYQCSQSWNQGRYRSTCHSREAKQPRRSNLPRHSNTTRLNAYEFYGKLILSVQTRGTIVVHYQLELHGKINGNREISSDAYLTCEFASFSPGPPLTYTQSISIISNRIVDTHPVFFDCVWRMSGGRDNQRDNKRAHSNYLLHCKLQIPSTFCVTLRAVSRSSF